jgi:hypothetical protein
MRKYIAAAFLAFTLAIPAFAADEVAPERLALAKQVMELSGATAVYNNYDKNLDTMLGQLRQYMPNADEQMITDIKKMAIEEFAAVKPALMENAAELYARRFSEDDLKALVAFYKSEAGKHFAAAMPELSAECIKLMEPFNKRFMARLQAYIADKVAAQKAAEDKNSSKDK